MQGSRLHVHHGVPLGDDAEGGSGYDWKEEGGTDEEGEKEVGREGVGIDKVKTTHNMGG